MQERWRELARVVQRSGRMNRVLFIANERALRMTLNGRNEVSHNSAPSVRAVTMGLLDPG